MVKATIEIPEREDRILNIVKGKYGFKNKTEALIFIVADYEKSLEPQLRPQYLKKLKKIDKQKGIHFNNIEELRNMIEKD